MLERPRKLTAEDLLLARIPERYWPASVKAIPDDTTGKTVIVKYVTNLRDNIRDGVGLLVYGSPGRGKTYAACAILKSVLRLGVSGMYLETSRIQKATIEREQAAGEDQKTIVDRAESVRFLVLDDLGLEHTNPWLVTQIESLVRYRVARKFPIVFTSNLIPANLAGIYGRGFMSVILDAVYPFKYDGADWRRDNGDEIKKRFS